MTNLIHNERVKLRAGALNTLATSCMSLGVLAPLAAAFYNVASSAVPVHTVIAGAALYLTAAFWLHRQAVTTLGRLRE